MNFNDNFETLEANSRAAQKLVGLTAARSCVLSSPADVSRITGAQSFAEISPKEVLLSCHKRQGERPAADWPNRVAPVSMQSNFYQN